ncbi:hypothetical protein [Micromonospora sp. NPDC005113]
MSLDTIADTLTGALPILATTAIPVLATTAGVALWWLHQDTDNDDHNVDDYKPATVAQATVARYQPPTDDRTQVIARVLPDGGTPLFNHLAAQQTARQWLRELADTHAFVNGVNEGSAL